MTRETKVLRKFGLAATVVALLSGCASGSSGIPFAGPSSAPPPTPTQLPAEVCESKIGFLTTRTGPNSALTAPMYNAAKLAVDQFRERHPGCDVELVAFDTGEQPDRAGPLAEKIAEDSSIIGVVGPAFSGEADYAIPVLKRTGVAMISPSASRPDLTRKPSTFHRIIAHDDEVAKAASRYITGKLKARSVYVVSDESSYGKVLLGKAKAALGGAVAGETTIGDELDYPAQVEEITSADPDAVFFAGYSAGGQLLTQLREAGSTAKFVTGDGAYDEAFLDLAGQDSAGAVIVCGCAPATESSSFTEDYEDAYGPMPARYTPWGVVEGYEATTVLLDALAAGNGNRTDVLSFVDNYDEQGISKPISFTDDGDLAQPTTWAYPVQDEKFGDAEVIE